LVVFPILQIRIKIIGDAHSIHLLVAYEYWFVLHVVYGDFHGKSIVIV